MLSVVIPVYVEPFLNQTIESLLANATGDVEIIPVFDGEQDIKPLPKDPRVKPMYAPHLGMRNAINMGIYASSGNYVMKIDAHCAVSPGYDRELTENCDDNWIMIPVHYALDEVTWQIRDDRIQQTYHYLSFPGIADPEYGYAMMSRVWYFSYPGDWDDTDISDTMTLQGGCWVVNKDYFMKSIYPMDDRPERYGTFTQEYMELGNKYWLGGGAIKVNKKVWYAHLSKRKHHYSKKMFSRLHRKDAQVYQSVLWSAKHWMGDNEPNMKYPFSWLVEKFWQVPTWPTNWRETWEAVNVEHHHPVAPRAVSQANG